MELKSCPLVVSFFCCRLYSCLANGSPDEFQRGEQLYRIRAVKDPLQIGRLSCLVDDLLVDTSQYTPILRTQPSVPFVWCHQGSISVLQW